MITNLGRQYTIKCYICKEELDIPVTFIDSYIRTHDGFDQCRRAIIDYAQMMNWSTKLVWLEDVEHWTRRYCCPKHKGEEE